MKRSITHVCLTFVFLLNFVPFIHAQTNTWVRKNDIGQSNYNVLLPRFQAISFTINGKVYIGCGMDLTYDYFNDMWEYDPATGAWTQIASAPQAVGGAVAFTIDSLGYMGTGYNYLRSSSTYLYYNNFYAYSPATNTWTQKANFPGTQRGNAVGFTIGHKGYIGTGGQSNYSNSGAPVYRDFYEYNPASDTWTEKDSLGGSARQCAVGFSSNGKGYIGTGVTDLNTGAGMSDLWEYDTTANTWTQKAAFSGGARFNATAMATGSAAYLSSGGTNTNTYTDLWKYDPIANSWSQKANFPGYERQMAIGFCLGDSCYMGLGFGSALGQGGGNADGTYNDLWRYDTLSNSWSNLVPNGKATYEPMSFSLGSSGYVLTSDSFLNIHTQVLDLWRFDQNTGAWTQMANFPAGNLSYAASFGIGRYGYIVSGRPRASATLHYLRQVWQYDTLNNTWAQKADIPFTPRFLSLGITIADKGYICGGRDSIGDKNDFWEYTPATDTWVQKANCPDTVIGTAGFGIGNNGYVTAPVSYDYSNHFWQYNTQADIWTRKTDYPESGAACVGFSIGSHGYIGTGGSGYDDGSAATGDLYEYDTLANTWTQKASLPRARQDAFGFSIGDKGYIGGGLIYYGQGYAGDYLADLWEYTPDFCTAPGAPVNTTPTASLQICDSGSTTLTASGPGSLSWYTAATGGSELSGDSSLTTSVLHTTTTFYVQDSTCTSGSRTAVTVVVGGPTTSTTNISICSGESYTFNGHTYDSAGMYHIILVNSAGCDSTATLILAVNAKPVTSIASSGGGLLTTGAFVSYQWLYNDTAIPNATTQSYLATADGNYRVVVTNGRGCIDTSATYSLTGLGVSSVDLHEQMMVYPNPANDHIIVKYPTAASTIMTISDELGSTIYSAPFNNASAEIDIHTWQRGIYFVKLSSDGDVHTAKVVKW